MLQAQECELQSQRSVAVLYRLRFEAKPLAVRFVPSEPCGSCVVSGLRFGLHDMKSSSVGWRWGRSRGGSGRCWSRHQEWYTPNGEGRRGVLSVGGWVVAGCHPIDQMGQWDGGQGCTAVVSKNKKEKEKNKKRQK